MKLMVPYICPFWQMWVRSPLTFRYPRLIPITSLPLDLVL